MRNNYHLFEDVLKRNLKESIEFLLFFHLFKISNTFGL